MAHRKRLRISRQTDVWRNLPFLVLDDFMGDSWKASRDTMHETETFTDHCILYVRIIISTVEAMVGPKISSLPDMEVGPAVSGVLRLVLAALESWIIHLAIFEASSCPGADRR